MMGVTEGRPWVGFSRWVLYRYSGRGRVPLCLCLSLPRLQSTRHRLGLYWLGAAAAGAVEGENQHRREQREM